MSIYQAWTKEEGKTEEVYTELQCDSEEYFRKYMQKNGRLITSNVFKRGDPKYLLAKEQIVTQTRTFGIGQLFKVAENDKGQGCYHALPMCEPDVSSLPDFKIEYDDDCAPYIIDDGIRNYHGDYISIPATAVEEYDTIKGAVKRANELDDENNFCYEV